MNNTEIILFSIIGFYACYCSIFVISLCKEYDIPQFTIQKLKYLYGKCKRSCCCKKRVRYSIVGEDEVEVEDENDTTNANISIDDNGITDDDENNVQIKMPPVTLTESHMQPTDIINNVKKDTTKTNSDYTRIMFQSDYDILHDSITPCYDEEDINNSMVIHNDIANKHNGMDKKHNGIASHIHTYRRNNLDTIYEYSDDDKHDALDNAGDFVPGENFKAPI
jgi:hypothetical protein